MVETKLNRDDNQGHIVLSPNMSVSWRDNLMFLYIVCSIALVIGLSFTLMGMWMVLPFTGLEIIALIAVIYYVSHKCHRVEVISVEDGSVRVECGYTRPQSCWNSELFWTRMIVLPQERPWHTMRVFLRGRDNQIEIGTFLSEDDKLILIKQLRQIVTAI